jgi:hypothetical protein
MKRGITAAAFVGMVMVVEVLGLAVHPFMPVVLVTAAAVLVMCMRMVFHKAPRF